MGEMAATTDQPDVASLAPLPEPVSPHRVRRGIVRLGALIVVAGALVWLLPGLGSLRNRFAHVHPEWVLVGVAFELLSALSYVVAFRVVFCQRMSWSTSYKIAMSEEGVDSLLPVGGAGGLALGAWVLRRGGMPTAEIGQKTVAFFLLTSVPNVAALAVLGLGLAIGVLPGRAGAALTVAPAIVAVGAVIATLALGRLARRLVAPLRASDRRRGLAIALRAVAVGVDEALRQLRAADPLLLLAIVGYMAFDVLVLWASFRAVGQAPPLTIVWIAYLIGQLGNLIPIPGGIGGVELGLIGALVLYGLPVVPATAAVLLYRVIELWVPALLGAVAFLQLRRLLRREASAIAACAPGEIVDIVGQGPVVAKPVRSMP
jgi:uncharacterized protein (TIRG00374 family)